MLGASNGENPLPNTHTHTKHRAHTHTETFVVPHPTKSLRVRSSVDCVRRISKFFAGLAFTALAKRQSLWIQMGAHSVINPSTLTYDSNSEKYMCETANSTYRIFYLNLFLCRILCGTLSHRWCHHSRALEYHVDTCYLGVAILAVSHYVGMLIFAFATSVVLVPMQHDLRQSKVIWKKKNIELMKVLPQSSIFLETNAFGSTSTNKKKWISSRTAIDDHWSAESES